jgi:NodT family efflux transporter outer membrane factor (OMF) lipoprotein
MPKIDLNKLHLTKTIPVSLPSSLVQQRPDVRAAEALLHSATAQVGVATANLLPQFNISGSYGFSGNQIPNLFSDANKTWNMLMQLTQPLFHGGALLAQRRATLAALDQSAAQYKQVVLQAFQNVADVLRALDTDARAFKEQKAAEISSYKNFKITAMQYRDGGVSYTQLLEAQQQYQQSRISSIQAQAMRYTDTASLYLALGGGWWNRHASRCDAVNRINASLHCP